MGRGERGREGGVGGRLRAAGAIPAGPRGQRLPVASALRPAPALRAPPGLASTPSIQPPSKEHWEELWLGLLGRGPSAPARFPIQCPRASSVEPQGATPARGGLSVPEAPALGSSRPGGRATLLCRSLCDGLSLAPFPAGLVLSPGRGWGTGSSEVLPGKAQQDRQLHLSLPSTLPVLCPQHPGSQPAEVAGSCGLQGAPSTGGHPPRYFRLGLGASDRSCRTL